MSDVVDANQRGGHGRPSPATLGALGLALALGVTGCDGCNGSASGRSAAAAPAASAPGSGSACPPHAIAATGDTRPAALAGSWYSADPDRLRTEVRGYLEAASPWSGARPIALISPHAGYRFSGPTAAHGYRALRGQRYRTIVLLGPSHRAFVRGIAVAPEAFFETPLGRVAVDRGTADALGATTLFRGDGRAHGREHSLEIQLPLLQATLDAPFAIVPLLVGELDRAEIEAAARTLRSLLGPDDLVIASSDFTHYGASYGYTPFSEQVPMRLDELVEQAWTAIAARDGQALLDHKERTGDTICGILPIAIVLAMLPGDAQAHRLRVDTSGRITGDWSSSVSYLSAAFTAPGWGTDGPGLMLPPGCVPAPPPVTLGPEARRAAHRIARDALERWVRDEVKLEPDANELPADPTLRAELGVFVTLKKHGELRGCIGNIMPRGPLYRAIAGRAIDAAEDDRFRSVTPAELGAIEIEISVLTPPQAIGGAAEVVLGRDGVILRKGARSAVFLPQVAPEQGWNVEQMLTHLALKAGLRADDWREGAKLEAFQALVF